MYIPIIKQQRRKNISILPVEVVQKKNTDNSDDSRKYTKLTKRDKDDLILPCVSI